MKLSIRVCWDSSRVYHGGSQIRQHRLGDRKSDAAGATGDQHPFSLKIHGRLIGWQDIRSETFIVSRGGPGPEIQDYLVKMLADLGFQPRIDIRDVGRESLTNLVAIGYGLTLTTTSVVHRDATGVVFKSIGADGQSLPSSAVWPASNANPALRHLLALATQLARNMQSYAICGIGCVTTFVTFNLLTYILA